MKQTIDPLDERRWQAVLERDADADGQFVFAVATTGVFCRPSCRARRPLRRNIRFYPDAATAQAAGFRPCKRCRPEAVAPQQQRLAVIADACRLLEREPALTLAQLAQALAVSPYHLHRRFKAATGMTPKAWQQAARGERMRQSLRDGEPVIDAALAAGFPAGSSYYRQADAVLGMTARQFRGGGERAVIRYAAGDCAVGRCLVAQSDRGICAVLLGDDDAASADELRRLFPRACCEPGDVGFQQRVAQIIASLDDGNASPTLPLDIRGSAFQQRVWQALRAIPSGETRSYRQIARQIGQPQAARAVAGACAANRLALVIPCHRVVRGDGGLAGYRWGAARKALLLRRESTEEEG